MKTPYGSYGLHPLPAAEAHASVDAQKLPRDIVSPAKQPYDRLSDIFGLSHALHRRGGAITRLERVEFLLSEHIPHPSRIDHAGTHCVYADLRPKHSSK